MAVHTVAVEQPRRMSKTFKNLLVDGGLFAAFLLVMNPRFTGMTLHEWIGAAFGATILLHLLLHWEWLAATTRRFLGRLPWRDRVNYVLNALLFIAFTAIMVSGLMISEVILPGIGMEMGRGGVWHGVHELASNLSILLIGLHLAFNWPWIVDALKRYVWRPLVGWLPARRSVESVKEVAS